MAAGIRHALVSCMITITNQGVNAMTQYAERADIMRLLQAVHHMPAIDAAILVAKQEDGSGLTQWAMELRIEHSALYGKEYGE
jgi:hypothetical protein